MAVESSRARISASDDAGEFCTLTCTQALAARRIGRRRDRVFMALW
jgi:hypothetical protein